MHSPPRTRAAGVALADPMMFRLFAAAEPARGAELHGAKALWCAGDAPGCAAKHVRSPQPSPLTKEASGLAHDPSLPTLWLPVAVTQDLVGLPLESAGASYDSRTLSGGGHGQNAFLTYFPNSQSYPPGTDLPASVRLVNNEPRRAVPEERSGAGVPS
eukprot:RCo000483